MTESDKPSGNPEEPKLALSASRQLVPWMAEHDVSLAFTTYRAGKLFLIGHTSEGRLSVFERTFERCMGLCADRNTIHISTLYQVWRFENYLRGGETHEGHDAVFVPKASSVTGDLDIHDMALDASGRLIFVNTLFSCLATLSHDHSFAPLWTPPFISRLAAEDRCHLNGLAMRDGVPAYVTTVSRADAVDGWREHRAGGGAVLAVATGETVADGLSMPHSPRWYRDRLWLHDSGSGNFGYVDPATGRFVPLTFCRGYLRGLAFAGGFAIAGLSLPRDSFAGLPLDAALRERSVEPMCAIQIIDLSSGDIVHWLKIDGIVEEMYDVAVLPGIRTPMALGFKTDEIRRTISVAEPVDLAPGGH